MRQNHESSSHVGGQRPTRPSTAVSLAITTGTTTDVLAEHARDVSNRTSDPVVQYALIGRADEATLVRRHWAAGLAPNVRAVANDPDCVSCAITQDVAKYASALATHQEMELSVIAPPGINPATLSSHLSDQRMIRTTSSLAVFDAGRLGFEVRSGRDLAETEIPTWTGDQRWESMVCIELAQSVDKVLLRGSLEDQSWSAALLRHLRATADDSSTDEEVALQTYSTHAFEPLQEQLLISAVEDIAPRIIRVDGLLALTDNPDVAMRLHVSGGLASLDAVGPWTADEPTSRLIVTLEPIGW